MSYKLCVIVPTYNHYTALPEMIEKLRLFDLPILIVDDGSDSETQAALNRLSSVDLMRLPINGGKGAAVIAGLRRMKELGFTHALQVDADGQHDLENVSAFIELSKNNPKALLSGYPVYDASLPTARKIGRQFTHVWVWIETLSFKIKDSMCGFRIYPVDASLALIEKTSLGKRMDFDIEIIVRLFWEGIPLLMHPVKVSYPVGNPSNFDVIKDNWRITKMHTRLVFTMLTKLPSILYRRFFSRVDESKKARWSEMAERGSVIGIAVTVACCRLLGRTACYILGAPVVLYFYLTGTTQREASTDYLKKVYKIGSPQKKPPFLAGFRHFMSFYGMLLDKFTAWSGRLSMNDISFDDREHVHEIMTGTKGGMLLVSHFGCMEFCRALTSESQKKRMHILMHTKNARAFNRVMRYFNLESALNCIEVSKIGPETVIFLRDRIECGDWVIIAADRTPISENPRIVRVPFLGCDAAFPQGPYILASLLQCPVYTAMATRIGKKYKVDIDLFADRIALQRNRKEECIREYAAHYARRLEGYCIDRPYQWYNFFDFWA